MSDPASIARTARESLSRGLTALQSDPNVPPAVRDNAASIAAAMGALHQIERSNGMQLVPHAHIAIENVRKALAALQANPTGAPSVNVAMESVAASLGLVHALSKLAGPPPGPSAAQPPPRPPPPSSARMPAAKPAPPQQAYAAPPPQQAPYQQQQQQQGYPPQQQPYQQQQQQQHQQPYPPQGYAPPGAPPGGHGSQARFPAAAQQPAPPPQQAAAAYPQAARDPFAPPPAAAPTGGVAAGAGGDASVVTADLGAQSATNFYKGLSGNDIIDHGGLFVSTYVIPNLGAPVRLRVSLPGGYEFEAMAIVRWAREQSDGSDAPPGFGAQFTQITPEARQLVYRYVRNREPLFHDDL